MKEYNRAYHKEVYVDEFKNTKRNYMKNRRQLDLNRVKNSELKTGYGITLEDYNKLLVSQNNVCAICHRTETSKLNGKVKLLSVDHNHSTDKVRGLLCGKCNSALGLLDEDLTIISNLVIYIRKHNSNA